MRLTWYVTDLDEYRASLKELGRAYRETIGALFSRDGGGAGRRAGRDQAAKIEIEATAVVPE